MQRDLLKNTRVLPANFGPLRGAGGNARVTGPCGDTVEFWIRVEGGRITRAGFTTDGCGHSIASGAAAARLAEGRTPAEALRVEMGDVMAAAGGLPGESAHCALLAANTLKEAVRDYLGRGARGGRAPIGAAGGEPAGDEALRRRLSAIRRVIVILSGKGGVGKSTVAVNLAVGLGRAGRRVGLLDIDLHGPSIPSMLRRGGKPVRMENGSIVPMEAEGIKVMSVGYLLRGRDEAVVWRGPMKAGVIRQLLGDVAWGGLDYLVVDSPPGTGDEPLSIRRLAGEAAAAVVVTTPQDVALADVRRSITFCRAVRLPVIGVIENMSGFTCPGCGLATPVFKSGGGERMAVEMGVPFLGRIPLDTELGESGEEGVPYISRRARTGGGEALLRIVDSIMRSPIPAGGERADSKPAPAAGKEGIMRIAVPIVKGTLASHFGHCEAFALIDADVEKNKIVGRKDVVPPPHEPGALPPWLAGHGAELVIAGGMGSRAQGLFKSQGIQVLTGAPAAAPEKIVEDYLAGALKTGANICDH